MEVKFLSVVMIDIKYNIFKENFPKTNITELKDAKQSMSIKPFLYDGNFAGEVTFQIESFIDNQRIINLEIKYGFVLSSPFQEKGQNITKKIALNIYPKFKELANIIYKSGSFSELSPPELDF